MIHWRNSRQRHQNLSWVLSLLLLLSPLLSQAQWIQAPLSSAPESTEMPCHQADANPRDDDCGRCGNSAGLLGCDCCQNSMPPSLTIGQTPYIHTCLHHQLQTIAYNPELPDPPPGSLYRPPILDLI